VNPVPEVGIRHFKEQDIFPDVAKAYRFDPVGKILGGKYFFDIGTGAEPDGIHDQNLLEVGLYTGLSTGVDNPESV
jgi:hypothetical protein